MSSSSVLLFDIDSTLIENHASLKLLWAFAEEVALSGRVDAKTVFEAFGTENYQRQLIQPNDPLTMDWDDIVETVAGRFDVKFQDKLLDRWQGVSIAGEIEVLDDAGLILERLKQSGRILKIATKGLSKYQIPVLEAVGLRAYFDELLSPDLTGYLKTDAGYFERLKAAHSEGLIIQIGDHYHDDVICAIKNGFHSIMRAPIQALAPIDPFERPQHLRNYASQIHTYPKGGSRILPSAVVLSLQELPAVIERIEAGE